MWDALIAEAALHRATVYGVKDSDGSYERMCGDPGKAVECGPQAITASGVRFNPEVPMVAVHAPRNYRLRKGKYVCFLHKSGAAVYLQILDKKGAKGFDLTPAAVRALGYTVSKHWSAKLQLCKPSQLVNYE